ncbi:MAG: PAS domain S-box protein, partial [Chloroflexi bacterium]|nr:PAS domain S-box protein [Chloroflexota bacterium]
MSARTRSLEMEIQERKQVEEALKENASLLRTVAENYPNSYVSIIEKDLTIGFTSGREFKKQNLDPAQFVGLSLEQVFGEHAPLVRDHYLKTFDGAETQFELLINNQYQYYRTVPLVNQNGKINKIMTVVENITERKQAEEAMRKSEARFRQMFEKHDAIMLLIEPQTGLIMDGNQSAAKFYGYEKSKLITMNINDINTLPPEQVTEERRKALEEKRNYFVFTHRLANGTERIVEVHSSPVFVNEKQMLFSVIHDISQRKHAEQALRESEEKYRLSELELKEAQSTAHIGNWKWDVKKGEITWSDEMYRIFGIEKDSYSGRLGDVIKRVIHPDDLHLVLPSNAATIANEPIEYRIIMPDLSIRHIWAKSGTTISGQGGEPAFLTGIAQDITLRKRAEALKEAAFEALQQKNDELQRWQRLTVGRELT